MKKTAKKPLPEPEHWDGISALRLWTLVAAIAVVFGGLAFRMVQLQTEPSDKRIRQAQRQQTGSLHIRGRRGRILDRNGVALAISIDADSIYARAEDFPEDRFEESILNLSEATGVGAKRLKKKLSGRAGFVWIARKVDPETARRVRRLEIPGVGFVKEPKRYYPGRTLGGHLLGFVGLDDEGLEGVELRYDEALRGQEYKLRYLRDVRGDMVLTDAAQLERDPAGNDISLTIDRRLQHVAETALAKAVRVNEAKSGQLLMMDPHTGEILASAVFPEFNPNAYRRHKPSEWRNRAATDGFEPGSTLKPFLIASAIENQSAVESDIFFCENGSYVLYDKTIRDVKPHEWLTVADILKVSSNIGSAKISEKVGAKAYRHTLRRFGFGDRTGSDLSGEISGKLTPAERWYPVDLANHAFGQGLLTTSLQMAQAYAALANGGKRMRPHVLSKVMDGDLVLQKEEPLFLGRAVDEDTAQRVLDMLKRVTLPGGTGTPAAPEGYAVAGKTGTAQKYDRSRGIYYEDKYISSFIGAIPASNPRLIVSVLIDEPMGKRYYGSQVAAPAFREAADRAMYLLGVPPDAPLESADRVQPDDSAQLRPARYRPEYGEGVVDRMPDLTGVSLREAIGWGKRLPAPLKIEGSGRAISQSPAPGEPLDEMSQPTVRLSWPNR